MTDTQKDTSEGGPEAGSPHGRGGADAPGEPRVERSIYGLTMFILRQIFVQKRWVLLPLWVALAVIVLMFLLSGSPLMPAIYIAF